MSEAAAAAVVKLSVHPDLRIELSGGGSRHPSLSTGVAQLWAYFCSASGLCSQGCQEWCMPHSAQGGGNVSHVRCRETAVVKPLWNCETATFTAVRCLISENGVVWYVVCHTSFDLLWLYV